jgi:hypothetical protein
MSVENSRLAAYEAPVFIAGDHVKYITVGCMPKFGQVRECNPNPSRGKIVIDWEDGSYSRVPLINVMKIDDGEAENDTCDSEQLSNGPSESDVDESTVQSELNDEVGVAELDGEGDEDDGERQGPGGEVGHDHAENNVQIPPQTINNLRDNAANQGRSGGGRLATRRASAGGRGRGGGRGPYVQPPPPTDLHVVMKKGNRSQEPVYQVWNEVDSVPYRLESGFPCYEDVPRLRWDHYQAQVFLRG